MIYITGDTHGDYKRFTQNCFPEQKHMTKDDYVIICGDFGGVWNNSPKENYWLDWLDEKPFTSLFITGNHENYDLLKKYKVTDYCGGKVQFIRPSVIHLMRGQVFTIENLRFFTMGGASSHDVGDRILSPDDPEFERKKKEFYRKDEPFRINHLSWWKEELPEENEYNTAWENLRGYGYAVDYIITHCPPESIRRQLELLGEEGYPKDKLTVFLEQVKEKTQYMSWFFGHYHHDKEITENHFLLYKKIVPLLAVYEYFDLNSE